MNELTAKESPLTARRDEPSPTPAVPVPGGDDALVMVIEPPRGWIGIDWAEIWRYRELVWFFTLRDVKGKMKQTVLGPLWVVLPAVVSSGIFSILLGVIAGLDSGPVPLVLYIFSGTVVWQLFTACFGGSSNCLMGNAGIFTKIYIPRLIMPIASTFGSLVGFGLQLALLFLAVLLAGITPTWKMLAVPLCAMMAMLIGLGVGIWLAALSVRYRDIRNLSTLIMPAWMLLTPIIYPAESLFSSTKIPAEWRDIIIPVYKLNPMYPVVQGFRWSMLGDRTQDPALFAMQPEIAWLLPIAITFIILISGMLYFRRVEATFADVV